MARKPRIHLPDAFYHVILRGNGKQDIFFADEDRNHFLLLLQDGVERFQHRIHAFCLMTNHVHLVMQVNRVPLSRIMQNLSSRYTSWINWRLHRCGHLFQGRYKAILVDADSYLLELVRYVHLNPVRAKVVSAPEKFSWSGHQAYCGNQQLPWFTTEVALGMLAPRKDRAVRAYRSFVEAGIGGERRGEFHGEGTADNRIVGGESFIGKVHRYSDDDLPVRVGVEDVIETVCRGKGIDLETFAASGKGRAGSVARGIAAWLIQDLPSCSLMDLSQRCGRDVSSLSAAAQRLRARAVSDASLRLERDELLAQITKCKA